jgi:hypothetical protein
MSKQPNGAPGAPEPDREELLRVIAELRQENALLRRSLCSHLVEHIEIDKEAMLRDFGKEPSLLEILAEMEQAHGITTDRVQS